MSMEQGNTTNSPKEGHVQTKDVRVEVTGTGWNPISWSQDIKTPGHGNNNGRIEFPHGTDNYDIIFTLVNDTGHDIRFDASKPVFIERTLPGSPYPHEFNTDQLMVTSCDARKLVIKNWNQVQMEFQYQLNFVTDLGDPVRPYDPIIQNDGGGSKPLIR